MLKLLVVDGRSMEPALSAGTFVLVRHLFWRLPRINDIVAFRCQNRGLLIKRVISAEPELGLYLGGDNIAESITSEQIGWVKPADIIGKVLWCSR